MKHVRNELRRAVFCMLATLALFVAFGIFGLRQASAVDAPGLFTFEQASEVWADLPYFRTSHLEGMIGKWGLLYTATKGTGSTYVDFRKDGFEKQPFLTFERYDDTIFTDRVIYGVRLANESATIEITAVLADGRDLQLPFTIPVADVEQGVRCRLLNGRADLLLCRRAKVYTSATYYDHGYGWRTRSEWVDSEAFKLYKKYSGAQP